VFADWSTVFDTVKGALMRRGRAPQDAEDLVHDAWIRVDAYARKNQVQNPAGLLMRVALNLSINEHWRQVRQGVAVLADDCVLADPAPCADAVLLAKERLRRLEAGLQQLTDRTRQLFLEHHREGKPLSQISEEQGISVTAVQKHCAKATMKLSRWMDGW
jgi:RNA polymerase sigma factor (sigma-70 family)